MLGPASSNGILNTTTSEAHLVLGAAELTSSSTIFFFFRALEKCSSCNSLLRFYSWQKESPRSGVFGAYVPGFGCGPAPRLSPAGEEASRPAAWLQGDGHHLGIALGFGAKATHRAPPRECFFGGMSAWSTVLGKSHPGRCKGWAGSVLQKEIRWMGNVNRETENAPKCCFWTAPLETPTPATYLVCWFFLSGWGFWCVVVFLNKSTVQFMLCCLAVAHGTKSLPPFAHKHLYLPLFLPALVLGKWRGCVKASRCTAIADLTEPICAPLFFANSDKLIVRLSASIYMSVNSLFSLGV